MREQKYVYSLIVPFLIINELGCFEYDLFSVIIVLIIAKGQNKPFNQRRLVEITPCCMMMYFQSTPFGWCLPDGHPM